MKYLSRFIIVIVILLIGWSSISSINLIMTKNIEYTSYIPRSITRSINQLKYNFVESIIDQLWQT